MSDIPDTLLVDGVDLRGIPEILIAGDMNLFIPGTRRGDDETIPRRDGDAPAAGLKYASYTFTVPIIVLGASRGARNAALAALSVTLSGTSVDGLVPLERHIQNTGGGQDAHTCQGRFIGGLALQMLNDRTGQTELQFKNINGRWKDASNNWLTY